MLYGCISLTLTFVLHRRNGEYSPWELWSVSIYRKAEERKSFTTTLTWINRVTGSKVTLYTTPTATESFRIGMCVQHQSISDTLITEDNLKMITALGETCLLLFCGSWDQNKISFQYTHTHTHTHARTYVHTTCFHSQLSSPLSVIYQWLNKKQRVTSPTQKS